MRNKRPWEHGYSLPGYLASEDPLQRGSGRTTAQLPRGTFGPVPKGLKMDNYVLPQYIRDEPIGSHARTTPQLPRGTVGPMPASMEKAGTPWSESTLESNGLGSLEGSSVLQPSFDSGDPLVEYGVRAANIILSGLDKLPPQERAGGLKAVLNEIDPKLFPVVQRERAKAKGKGESESRALKKALENALQSGLLNEFVRLGKKKKIEKKSQLALAAYHGQYDNYGLGRAAETRGLSGLSSFLGDIVDAVGGAACKVASNPITPLAAGAGGAFLGGPEVAPLAMAGAGIAAGACAPDAPKTMPFPQSQSSAGMPGWALPVIAGVGLLALVVVLKD